MDQWIASNFWKICREQKLKIRGDVILLKKLNQILNTIIGAFVGVFIGHGIYVFWDFKTHPDLYAMQSAPWYTSILLYGIVTVVVLIAAVIIKLIIRQKLKKEYHNG